MVTEREVLLWILRLTVDKSKVEIKEFKERLPLPFSIVKNILKDLDRGGLITFTDDNFTVTCEQRVTAAVKAVSLGLDIETVCAYLTWAEFENISTLAFVENGFDTKQHLRFKYSGKRWEVDIIAWRGKIAVAVDCKHWKRNWRMSYIRKIVETHLERTRSLAEALPLKGLKYDLNRIEFVVPTIISLVPGPLKFYLDVPIVPVLQLGDFISSLTEHLSMIKHFIRKPIGHNIFYK